MIPRYNTITQILIRFKYDDNKETDPEEVKKNTSALFGELFPNTDKHYGDSVNTFRTQVYCETHQITWDISGAFNVSTSQLMDSESELDAMQKHFGKVLTKYFAKYDAEYKVYACGYNEPVLECTWKQ